MQTWRTARGLGFAALVASCAAQNGTADDWTDTGAADSVVEAGSSDAGIRAPCTDDSTCLAVHDCGLPQGTCPDGCRDGGCGTGANCDSIDHTCRCRTDEDCSDTQFCDLGTGTCREGCRMAPDNCVLGDRCGSDHTCVVDCDIADCGCREGECGPDKTCDPVIRVCMCTGDESCDAEAWCDVSVGLCLVGCRIEPDMCPDGSTCVPETHTCEAPTVCCAGVDGSICTVTLAAACGGRSIGGLFECDPNPCASSCLWDGDCTPATYCSAEHLCVEGCRTGTRENCGEGQVCEPSTHACVEAAPADPCATDEDCADLQTFCDLPAGICVPGCRLDPQWNSCGPDLTCMDDHTCWVCDRICGEHVVSCNEPCP